MSLNLKITAAIYAVGGLCTVNVLPWATMPIALTLTFSLWAFDIHTRTHTKGKYPILEELMPLVMSPFSVGLNEQRRLHLQHHSKLGTTKDPDHLYYSQGAVASLFLCVFHPEISFARSLPSMPFWAKVRAGARFYLFLGLCAICGANFLLWYLLPLRLMFGAAQFSFTWLLHHREEERTIDIVLPAWMSAIVGSVGMQEFASHKAHHRFSANRLIKVDHG